MSWIGALEGIGAYSAYMMVDELNLLIWWSICSNPGSIDLHKVISSSIYTTNKQIGGVNN